jgi:hypothetical protein
VAVAAGDRSRLYRVLAACRPNQSCLADGRSGSDKMTPSEPFARRIESTKWRNGIAFFS